MRGGQGPTAGAVAGFGLGRSKAFGLCRVKVRIVCIPNTTIPWVMPHMYGAPPLGAEVLNLASRGLLFTVEPDQSNSIVQAATDLLHSRSRSLPEHVHSP